MTKRRQRLFACLLPTYVAGLDFEPRLVIGLRRHQGNQSELVWRGRKKILKGSQKLTRVGGLKGDIARENSRDWVQCHLECGDDAEVAASSSNGPVEVWVLLRARLDLSSVGQHQVRGKDVVAAKAVLAHQWTNAPAEKKPSHTHRRTLAQHGRDSGLCGLNLNRPAQHSAAHAGIAFAGSYGDVAEARHFEHDATLTGGVASIIMASAADSERQMIGPYEAQSGLDVLRVHRTDYEQ